MGDPFDIDRCIGGVPNPPIPTPNPLHSNNTGDCNTLNPFPGLNSHMNNVQVEESGESIPDSCEQGDANRENQEDQSNRNEIAATMEMGKALRVSIDNFEEMVRSVIEGEVVTYVV
ncbi:hypothetical protein L1987_25435 [Smallanthus sonchifolius]|uniref:Uncharacterized protein n=1 Tax=Smallanthus sonchifolius TaxID=185202 RepID=A0ACB9IN86_9ASTR|nr:hypothetical protein L1987_25435 [Smallanthus sonchifolius]